MEFKRLDKFVTIRDFGEEPGCLSIAMELLEGADLDGLTFAHAKGIIHRDLRPGKMLVQRNGQVKMATAAS